MIKILLILDDQFPIRALKFESGRSGLKTQLYYYMTLYKSCNLFEAVSSSIKMELKSTLYDW